MTNGSFENAMMQSMQIACLSSIRGSGLISDKQYDELVSGLGESFSKAEEEERKKMQMEMKMMQEESQKTKYYVDGTVCPIWEKKLLSIDEAAKYFGIGTNKLREMTAGEDCDYVVWNGSKRLIKRERFGEFLDTQFSV